jgi:hypothetical protein
MIEKVYRQFPHGAKLVGNARIVQGMDGRVLPGVLVLPVPAAAGIRACCSAIDAAIRYFRVSSAKRASSVYGHVIGGSSFPALIAITDYTFSIKKAQTIRQWAFLRNRLAKPVSTDGCARLLLAGGPRSDSTSSICSFYRGKRFDGVAALSQTNGASGRAEGLPADPPVALSENIHAPRRKRGAPERNRGPRFHRLLWRQPFARLSMPLLWCKSGNAN